MKPRYPWSITTLFFAMISLVTACSQPGLVETGSASLGVATQALSTSNVQRVTITISGANISPNIVQDLVKVGNQWKGIIGKIPAGSGRTFLAQAYDNTVGGNLIYEGTTTNVTITKSQTTTAVILLQQKTAPDPFSNAVPVINSLVASANAVGFGETVNLDVNASDPNTGDTLTYTWSSSAGTFSSTSTTSTVWTAPSTPGLYTINIEVMDQKMGKTTASLTIDVQSYHSRGKAQIQISFNTWPTVTKVWADKGRINVNEATGVHVTATDNDNNSLSYSWASDCGGTFSSTTSTDPNFTAPSTLPTSGKCKLTVTVSDGNGGTTTGDVTIQIGAPLDANIAPLLITTFQSEEQINNGATVTLRVVATDPNGDNMTFQWVEIGGPNGTLSTPTSTATTSALTWTADSNKCSATVRVIVTDDGNPNATTTHDFSILCDNPTPVAKTIVAGSHACTLLNNGTVKCWGKNSFGQLGLGDITHRNAPPSNPINLGAGPTVKQIDTGYNHTCAIMDDDTLKCWGNNIYGQLGYGDTTQRTTPSSSSINLGAGRTAKQISVGGHHTCALLDNNTVKCWGRNNHRQLGDGNNTNLTAPPTNTLNLGAGRTAIQISSGSSHTCALLDDNTLKCWGRNLFGQLGYGDNTNRSTPPSNPINLGTGRTAKQISAKFNHTCAILDNDTLKCWGYNGFGQLGLGDTAHRNLPPNSSINLGAGRTAKQVSVGEYNICALLDNDTVKCWGRNNHGQLGYGDTIQRNTPASTPINLGPGRTAKQISTGSHYNACALLDNDTVTCWGRNNYGQLGYGDTTSRNAPPSSTLSF